MLWRSLKSVLVPLFSVGFLFFVSCGKDTPPVGPINDNRIFFGTNRAVEFNGGNQHRGENAGTKLSVGSYNIVIEPGYSAYEFSHMTPNGGETFSLSEFDKRVQSAVQGSNDILIFIHGFNNSFLDAAKTILQMKTDQKFNGPIFFFSWPSAGSSTAYLEDEEQATSTLTAKSFREFLDRLVTNSKGKRLHLIAHSMGNRVLLEGLRSYTLEKGNTAGIQSAVFVAPDEALTTFKLTLELLLGRSDKTNYTLYVNRNDYALQLSKSLRDKLVNGNDTRTGAIDPKTTAVFSADYPTRPELHSNIASYFRLVDVSSLSRAGNSDHAYFRDHWMVVDDLANLFKGQTGSRRTQQTDASGRPYYTIP